MLSAAPSYLIVAGRTGYAFNLLLFFLLVVIMLIICDVYGGLLDGASWRAEKT